MIKTERKHLNNNKFKKTKLNILYKQNEVWWLGGFFPHPSIY